MRSAASDNAGAAREGRKNGVVYPPVICVNSHRMAYMIGALGDWIIKTPSTTHKHVPLNEYTAMHLAELAGFTIPDIRLVEMDKLEQLPSLNLPSEPYAFAIRRFDRHEAERIHMENFAQILVKYPQEKYRSANYQNIGKILYNYAEDGLGDVQQLARRLLINILLANGDAHLKNWSVIYPDTITPFLSPAYDIVTTHVYMGDQRKLPSTWAIVRTGIERRWTNSSTGLAKPTYPGVPSNRTCWIRWTKRVACSLKR